MNTHPRHRPLCDADLWMLLPWILRSHAHPLASLGCRVLSKSPFSLFLLHFPIVEKLGFVRSTQCLDFLQIHLGNLVGHTWMYPQAIFEQLYWPNPKISRIECRLVTIELLFYQLLGGWSVVLADTSAILGWLKKISILPVSYYRLGWQMVCEHHGHSIGQSVAHFTLCVEFACRRKVPIAGRKVSVVTGCSL